MPITAPYNFVPLYHLPYLPEWGEAVCQDAPFEDSTCGTFKLKVTAKTPTFVRGTDDKSQFFQTPDKKLAIPGTTLRGMLRNVVEIASFSKMTRVNNHTYGVRDLHNQELYGQHMAKIMPAKNGKSLPLPLVGAGWLRKKDETFEIIPCDFAKIHYERLIAYSKQIGVKNFDPGRKQSSVDKYDFWKASLKAFAQIELLRDGLQNGWVGSLGQITGIANAKSEQFYKEGTLVFTGQPSQWDPKHLNRGGGGHPKHHDFFFYNRQSRSLVVDSATMDAFNFVHRDSGQQNRMESSPNREWGFWKKKLEQENAEVPVFYLCDEKGKLRAFGLAMMFRLAYKNSTLQAVRATQKDDKNYDLSELIFGHVPLDAHTSDAEMHAALKGRVSIGLALAQGTLKHIGIQNLILGAPKASYYPAYVEQGAEPGEHPQGKGKWKSYMDDTANLRVRGWKRYRPQEKWGDFEGLDRAGTDVKKMDVKSDKVKTSFNPVDVGSSFVAPVRIHNLRKVELGALLWAIQLGGFKEGVHVLGMGKPYGFGSVILTIESWDLRDMGDQPVDQNECIDLFEKEMETWASKNTVPGGWKGSRTIHELFLLSVPVADRNSVRYLSLDHPSNRNEFQAAKQNNEALLSAGRIHWRGPSGFFQRIHAQTPVTAMPSRPLPVVAKITPTPPGGVSLDVQQRINLLNRERNLPGSFAGLVAECLKMQGADQQAYAKALIQVVNAKWPDGRKRDSYKSLLALV